MITVIFVCAALLIALGGCGNRRRHKPYTHHHRSAYDKAYQACHDEAVHETRTIHDKAKRKERREFIIKNCMRDKGFDY